MDDVFPEEQDVAAVGAVQAVGQLEQDAFAHPRRPKQNARFVRAYREADVLQYRRPIERDGNVSEHENRIACFQWGWNGGDRVAHRLNIATMIWLRRKSTKMISTEAVTTAWMVE